MTVLKYGSSVMLLLDVVIDFVFVVCGREERSVSMRVVVYTYEDLVSGLLWGEPWN